MHYCNMLMLVVLCEGIIELTCMQKSDTISNIQSAILIPKKKKKRRRKGEEEEEEEEEEEKEKKRRRRRRRRKQVPQFYISQLLIDRLCGCYW